MVDIKLITDKTTKRSKGFAYIEWVPPPYLRPHCITTHTSDCTPGLAIPSRRAVPS